MNRHSSLVLSATLVSLSAALSAAPYAAETASRAERFANPPASARILPIQHGQPREQKRLDVVLDTLEAEGFGGYAGNVNFDNYLKSDPDWKAYAYKLRNAHARGLVHWLYDEKGYPSCTAGGLTLEGHPEWQARAYLVAVTNVPAGSAALPPSPPGKPVATLRRKSADGKVETVYVVTDDYIREGTHVSVSVSHYKYAYPNLLMAEPTARFIELTHDAYARELGDALPFVTSTFTDEPSLMTLWMRPMPYLCLPVSDELLAAYAKEAGHPLAEDVPALVGGAPEGAVAAARHRFWSMVGARVAQNYTGQLTRWCTAHGIESGGHLLSEESLVAHVPLYGDFFRVLRGLSAPSADILTSIPTQVPWITPLLVGSAADLNGAKHAMSEASDHSQRYRREGDKRPQIQVTAREVVGSLNRQIWGGINTFTSYYRWGAFSREAKRAINEEIGRTITLVREGHNAAEIALLYPADSLMVGFEPRTRGGGGAGAQRTASFVNAVGRSLFQAGRAFMFTDQEALSAARVEADELVHGKLRWRTVILPGVTTLPLGVARALEAFRQAGGLVIAAGDRPVNSETEFPSAEVTRLASNWTFLPDAQAVLLTDLVDARHVRTLSRVRGPKDSLRVSHRHTDAGDVFFVMNDSGEAWCGAVRLLGGGAARVWNPRIGLSFDAAGDIPLELSPYAGVVLTTDKPVTGRLLPGAAAPFATCIRPFSEPVKAVRLSKGQYVQGAAKALPRKGWQRVETTLTKGGVDTFAFLGRIYAKPMFPADAKGVGFSVRVPETTVGSALSGVFLVTRDGQQWYAGGRTSLSKSGEFDVVCAFSEFNRHGSRAGASTRLDPNEIVEIRFGYGGYYGTEGERVVFEVSEPGAFALDTSAESSKSSSEAR